MTSLTTSDELRRRTATTCALQSSHLDALTAKLAIVGEQSTRFGLAVVIAWIGAMKFTSYEAEAISGLVANSPLISWVYTVLNMRAASAGIGIIELLIASSLLVGALLPRIGVAGGIAATGMFLTTLSFLITTPGAFEPSLGGFPALSVLPGQFLIKDLVLAGASVWLAGRALQRARECRQCSSAVS